MDCSASKKFPFIQALGETLTMNLLKDSPPTMLLSFAESHSLAVNYRVITYIVNYSLFSIITKLQLRTISEI